MSATSRPTAKTSDDVVPIPGFPGYFATRSGRVYSALRGGLRGLKTWLDRKGYSLVRLRHGGRFVWRRIHRLVLTAFVGSCPPGMEARHLNDVKADNRLSNLCWGTKKENAADAIRNGRTPRGARNGGHTHPERLARGDRHGSHTHPERRARGERVHGAKLTELDVVMIRSALAAGISQSATARVHHVSRRPIHGIAHGTAWRHVA